MATNPLPDFVSSLSKYHTVKAHFEILLAIDHDMPVEELIGPLDEDLVATARQRYLLMENKNIVIRDRLVDLAHTERDFTERMRMLMYFLFMFRDRRYRDFICHIVGKDRGKWDTTVFPSATAGEAEFAREGGRKAFTNLRRFLIHTGILNEEYKVHFPELALWFPWAVEICAQYITDAAARQHFLTSPHGFLIKYRLNALLNATPEELSAVELGGTYEAVNDSLPTYESPERPGIVELFDFRLWDRARPTRVNLATITSNTDPAVLERANHQHFLLEKAMVALCRENGLRTRTNRHIDVLAENDNESIIFEMKSSGPGATRAQIRRALSQLFEYRYLYRESLQAKQHLCVVIERKPRGTQEWLIPYLASVGVGLIWKNDDSDLLNCLADTRDRIAHLIPQLLQPNFSPHKQ
jgi:hypothetical protein